MVFFRFPLTVPSSIDLFMIWVMMGAKMAAYSFTSDDDIGSNSHILACDFLISSVTAVMVVNLNLVVLCFCGIGSFKIHNGVRSSSH